MKKLNAATLVYLGVILLVINILSQRYFARLDLTEGKQYTLSKATKNILRNLDEQVIVTAYFSEGISPEVKKIKSDFEEMLQEYKSRSKGNFDFTFVDPSKNDELKAEAMQHQIPELLVSVREKDQSKQAKAFMGAVMKMGGKKEVMPAVLSTEGLEYSLTTNIKKMAVKVKPLVGIIQGHGEPGLQELNQVQQTLSILDSVQMVNLGFLPDGLSKYEALILLAPSDSLPPDHLALLDEYLSNGGNLFIGINRVTGDLQSQFGTMVNTGLEGWLYEKGIHVDSAFVLDAQCGTVSVQQQQGFFVINTPVQFPYLPLVSQFPKHPITDGLEQVMLVFASPVNFYGQTGTFTPLLLSSAKSAISPAPTMFDVFNKKWTANDFNLSNIILGGVLEGLPGGGKLVVIGDGDFPFAGQRGQNNDNISLLVNAIDWMLDDTGLIELRTKSIATRPISEEYLGDESAGKRNFLKYLNFGLPIALVLLFWFFRSQRQRSLRMKRMQERYV